VAKPARRLLPGQEGAGPATDGRQHPRSTSWWGSSLVSRRPAVAAGAAGGGAGAGRPQRSVGLAPSTRSGCLRWSRPRMGSRLLPRDHALRANISEASSRRWTKRFSRLEPTSRSKKASRPELGAFSRYERRNGYAFQSDQQWTVGVQLRVPLFDGGMEAAASAGSSRGPAAGSDTEEQRRLIAVEVERRAPTWL